jgi:hypothetical protein
MTTILLQRGRYYSYEDGKRMKKRTEMLIAERQRFVIRAASLRCPVCQSPTELLTTRQAGRLFQVTAASIRCWLKEGKVHGFKTPGGQHRVCRNSILPGEVNIHGTAALRNL